MMMIFSYYEYFKRDSLLGKVLSSIQSMAKGLEGANSSLPSWIQNLGLALLSILIPLAIAILTDLIQKKRSEIPMFELDLQVILDHVFKIKQLLFFSILIFTPFIFWENSNGLVRLGELTLSLTGSAFVANTILDVYFWTRGDVFSYRLAYLQSLSNLADLEIAFKSVWSSKEINPQKERELFSIFCSKIDKIVTLYEKRR